MKKDLNKRVRELQFVNNHNQSHPIRVTIKVQDSYATRDLTQKQWDLLYEYIQHTPYKLSINLCMQPKPIDAPPALPSDGNTDYYLSYLLTVAAGKSENINYGLGTLYKVNHGGRTMYFNPEALNSRRECRTLPKPEEERYTLKRYFKTVWEFWTLKNFKTK